MSSFTLNTNRAGVSVNILLLFCSLLRVALGANPLFHICSVPAGNYTADSPYRRNLEWVQSNLYYQAPWSGGFAVSSVGSQQPAYGLAQCRPDVHFSDCRSCISDARKDLPGLCPDNKGAIIWYDFCLFKYLDQDFFGQIDSQDKFCMSNVNNVSDPVSFDGKATGLLRGLAQRALVSPRLFASGQVKFDDTTTIYALVDCTRDLSSLDCKKCLDETISELMPDCSGGKQGGRITGASCHVGYEIYPFVIAN
ncbi:hypothetical protein Dimus_009640 [Dionaea muscipula]